MANRTAGQEPYPIPGTRPEATVATQVLVPEGERSLESLSLSPHPPSAFPMRRPSFLFYYCIPVPDH